MAIKNAYLQKLMETVEKRNANDKQFLITVRSVLESVEPVVEAHPEYIKAGADGITIHAESCSLNPSASSNSAYPGPMTRAMCR